MITIALTEDEAQEILQALRQHGGDEHTYASTHLGDLVSHRIRDAREMRAYLDGRRTR